MLKELVYSIIMSGASSLSAAKRRRAGGDVSLDNNTNNRNTNNRNTNNGPIRIQDVVISHEQRLQDIEKIFTEDEGNIVINNVQESDEYKNQLNIRLEKIEKEIKPDVNDKENIEYYKNKIKTMEEQIEELKKTMLNIQNIAMDTNTAFMDFKNNALNE